MIELKPYPNYKRTGARWLDKVPDDWVFLPAKAAFRERKMKSLPDDVHLTPSQTHGVLPQSEYIARTGNKVVLNLTGADAMRHVEPDDFISHLRSFQGGFEFSRERGKVSAAYTVLQPLARVVPEFYRYLFKSTMYVQALQTTTDQLRDGQSIRFAQVALIDLPMPDAETQVEIAGFLDRETAEIDAFIADQEELIALLTERRSAVHTAHFERVVHIRSTSNGGSPLGVTIAESDVRVGKADRELLSVSIHRGLVPWGELHDKQPKADSFTAYKAVEPGNVVLNRMRAFQGAAGVASQHGMVSPDYAVFIVSAASSPEYIGELLRSVPMIEAIKLRLRGIGDTDSGAIRTPRVNVRDLFRVRVELPDLTSQLKTLHELIHETAELDAAIADGREAIALSRERRAALISAAVTGKIDVRGLA